MFPSTDTASAARLLRLADLPPDNLALQSLQAMRPSHNAQHTAQPAAPAKRMQSGQSARQRALLDQICQPALLPSLLEPMHGADRQHFLFAQFGSPKNALMALLNAHSSNNHREVTGAKAGHDLADNLLNASADMRAVALSSANAARHEDQSAHSALRQAAAVLPHLGEQAHQQTQCLRLLERHWQDAPTLPSRQLTGLLSSLSRGLPVIEDIHHWHTILQKVAQALTLQRPESQAATLVSLVDAAIHCEIEEQAAIVGLVAQHCSSNAEPMLPVLERVASNLSEFAPVLRSQMFYLLKAGFDQLAHSPSKQLNVLKILLDKLEESNEVLQGIALTMTEEMLARLPADNGKASGNAANELLDTARDVVVVLARSLQQMAAPLQPRVLRLLAGSALRFERCRHYQEGVSLALAHGAIGAPRTTDVVRDVAFAWVCAQLPDLSVAARQTALLDLIADCVLLNPASRRYVSEIGIAELAHRPLNGELLRILVVASPQLDAQQRHCILGNCHPAIAALSQQPEAQGALAVAIIDALPLLMNDPTAVHLIGEILETGIGVLNPATPMLAKILGAVALALPRVPPETAQYLLHYLTHRMHHLVGHSIDMSDLLSTMLMAGIQMEPMTPLLHTLYGEVVRHILYLPHAGEEQQMLSEAVHRLPYPHGMLFQQITDQFCPAR